MTALSGSLSLAKRRIKLAVVTTKSYSGVRGGAERLYRGLVQALESLGFDVDQINVSTFETSFSDILKSYLRFYDLDLSGYDGVISTKAPSYMLRHRNHVCYLPHTMRVFYDRYRANVNDPMLETRRRTVMLLDSVALRQQNLKGLFCVGREVQQRLKHFINIDSDVLHHPSTLLNDQCYEGQYLFLPGRLHGWKRVDLGINAIREMRERYPLMISGTGEQEGQLKELAKDLPGVKFVGYQSDEQLALLYANAQAVIFPTVQEDFGLVALEAFASAKPVITCSDSGEPARLVSHGYNGFVCEPNAVDMSKYLDWITTHRNDARKMGQNGRAMLDEMNWDVVCEQLLSRLGFTDVMVAQ